MRQYVHVSARDTITLEQSSVQGFRLCVEAAKTDPATPNPLTPGMCLYINQAQLQALYDLAGAMLQDIEVSGRFEDAEWERWRERLEAVTKRAVVAHFGPTEGE